MCVDTYMDVYAYICVGMYAYVCTHVYMYIYLKIFFDFLTFLCKFPINIFIPPWVASHCTPYNNLCDRICTKLLLKPDNKIV